VPKDPAINAFAENGVFPFAQSGALEAAGSGFADHPLIIRGRDHGASALARKGVEVTALDFSPAQIAPARLVGQGHPQPHVHRRRSL
jgi:hypothetical protein